MSARQKVLKRLEGAAGPLAVHEFELMGVSQNALATELSTLQRAGLVIGNRRAKQRYYEWRLTERYTNPTVPPTPAGRCTKCWEWKCSCEAL